MPSRCFAIRRLAPFLGTLQVVEMAAGRALSADGSRWQIELLGQPRLGLAPWGEGHPPEQGPRFFHFGNWSRGAGLMPAPVNAVLGDQSDHPALGPLLEVLERLPRLPFPLLDSLEHWLLDASGTPLALVASRQPEGPPGSDTPPVWRAFPDGLAAARNLAGPIEALIHAAAGTPAHHAWVRRHRDGSGEILPTDGSPGAHWPAAIFPELLVREDWPAPADRDLIRGLLEWLAPALLTLPGLRQETRRRLEQAAIRRPPALYRYRKLLPEMLDRGSIETALVAAHLRGTLRERDA